MGPYLRTLGPFRAKPWDLENLGVKPPMKRKLPILKVSACRLATLRVVNSGEPRQPGGRPWFFLIKKAWYSKGFLKDPKHHLPRGAFYGIHIDLLTVS